MREKIEAKNKYENYIYQMKSTIEDEGLKTKLGEKYEEIKEKLGKAEETLYVEQVSKEEYEAALRELETFINPIMQGLVNEGGGEYMDPSAMPPPTSRSRI